MKTLNGIKNLAFIGLLFIVLVSCAKKNDKTVSKDDIVGTWTVTSTSTDMKVNGISIVQFLVDQLGITQEQAEILAALYAPALAGTITINADGTYDSNFEGEPEDDGTWELSADGKVLTMDKGTEDETLADVIILTSSNLTIVINQIEYDDIDEDGSDDTITLKITVNLTK